MNLNFTGFPEEREASLDDIQVYLTEDIKPSKFETKQEELVEDELLKPYHWMGYLEETVSQLTGGTISLPKFGVGSKDYIKAEKTEGLDLQDKFAKFKVRWQSEDIDSKELNRRFVETIAIPDYLFNTQPGADVENLYEITSDHLNFLYYNNLQLDESKFTDMEKLQSRINSPTHAGAGDTEDVVEEDPQIVQNELVKRINEQQERIYNEENFDDSDPSLIQFWETLHLKTQYELFAGSKTHLLTNSLRSCLWKQMRFDIEGFRPFITGHYFEDQTKIGMNELQQIWQNIDQEENKSDDSPLPILIQNKNEEEEEEFRKVKSTKRHISLIENLVRGKTPNIIVELSKIRKIQDKLKYLSNVKHTKNDQKLMLWLLTPLQIKMEIILRIKDPILYTFTTYMLLEEIYDNIYLLDKFETGLHQEMKNKVYMFFFFFTNFEAIQRSVKKTKEEIQEENDMNTLEYIEFLERQLQSTNHLKQKYLNKVNEILEKEEPKVGSKELSNPTEYVISSSTIKSVTEYEDQDRLAKSRVTEFEDDGLPRTPPPQNLDDQFSPTEENLLTKRQERIKRVKDKTAVRKLSTELDEAFDGPRAQPRIADIRKKRREQLENKNE